MSARLRCGCIPVLSVPVPTTRPAAIRGRRSPATRLRNKLYGSNRRYAAASLAGVAARKGATEKWPPSAYLCRMGMMIT